MRKLRRTVRIVTTLFMARTFGRYEGSGWNGEFDYAQYRWRGRSWVFPLSPVEYDS